MNKLFLHLIGEFRRLGSTIVYANFNKIIVCTKKKKVDDAIAYVQYVVNNIRNKELFHSIDISFNQCWEYLLWLDLANHGGIKGKLPKEIGPSKDRNTPSDDENDEERQNEATEDDDEPVVEMNWNISKYLPEWCGSQSSFDAVIASYINAIYEKISEESDKFAPGCTPMQRKSTSQSTNNNSKDLPKKPSDFAKELISGDLAQKLYFITQKIQKKGSNKRGEDLDERSSLLDDSVSLSNPALEFVKSICKILSLDTEVSDQVID